MSALSSDLEAKDDGFLANEFASAFGVARPFYTDEDREALIREYQRRGRSLPPYVVYQDEGTGLWVVAVWSPLGRYIVQSERALEMEAWTDARNWDTAHGGG